MNNGTELTYSNVTFHCDYCGDWEEKLPDHFAYAPHIVRFADRAVCYDCVVKALDKLLGPPTLEEK